ncbi:hypothetical protein AALO_G00121620 [Alosa alosa]|uniref:Uncharacterized protein n=1 Tax=Alosa alosa TaxID=278164 RepID=A0AAV6GK43_9TELE|nr:hypothetical protein AALO_G00121620 [Alosa alosa]
MSNKGRRRALVRALSLVKQQCPFASIQGDSERLYAGRCLRLGVRMFWNSRLILRFSKEVMADSGYT